MVATANTQAIQLANQLVSLGQTLYSIQDQINLVNTQFTQLAAATIFNNMSTTAVNTDGTLGTADTTPTTGHVIDPRVYTGLNRAVSASTLATLNTFLGAVLTLLQGGAATQQGEAPQLLNEIVGG